MVKRRRLLARVIGGIYAAPVLRELPSPGSYAAVSPSLGKPPEIQGIKPVGPYQQWTGTSMADGTPRGKPIPPRTGDGGLVGQ